MNVTIKLPDVNVKKNVLILSTSYLVNNKLLKMQILV